MRIVVVGMVRNEADIIELFVRWQLRFADHVLLLDHASSDATSEILSALCSEGLPLCVERSERAEMDQSQATSALVRRAVQELDPDWVLPFDADELLVATAGGSPRQVIEQQGPRLHHVLWQTYVARPEDLRSSLPLLQRIEHRYERERLQNQKLLVPASLLRRRFRFASGNHRLLVGAGLGRKKVPSVEATGLRLAHLPIRSVEQARSKALIGWLARLSGAEQHLEPGKGIHLGKLFDVLRTGEDPAPDALSRLPRVYAASQGPDAPPAKLVHAPLAPPGGPLELRYTRPPRSTYALLVDFAENLAKESGARRARARCAGGCGSSPGSGD